MHFDFEFDTKATPAQVLAAYTDFTPNRVEIWKESLDPDKYEVREVGENWAIIREGSARPNVWAVERYDWSPGKVSWAAEESNFCEPGSGIELTITPNSEGGSHVEGTWHRKPTGLKGDVLVAMGRIVGPKIIPKGWAKALDRYAESATSDN